MQEPQEESLLRSTNENEQNDNQSVSARPPTRDSLRSRLASVSQEIQVIPTPDRRASESESKSHNTIIRHTVFAPRPNTPPVHTETAQEPETKKDNFTQTHAPATQASSNPLKCMIL